MKRSKWSRLNTVGYVTMGSSMIIFLFQGEFLMCIGALVMAKICFNQIEVLE